MKTSDIALIKQLCEVFAPSGNESAMKEFLLQYIDESQTGWKVQPTLIHGPKFQDCLILKFGQPRTAIFAHIDSIGFTVRYENQLVPIGGPETESGYKLVGQDQMGPIECKLKNQDDQLFYDFGRGIQTGTDLVFKSEFRETQTYIQAASLDNRLGVYNALKVAETMTDGLIIFSCREEHGGGTVPFLCKYIYEKFQISQSLISDITWVTEGVTHGNGVAISLRDMSIPRKAYVDKVVELASASGIKFQIEVERSGGSDGREIQSSPYPIDWCFVGAPENHVHTPDELVYKEDLESMVALYKYLMKNL